MKHTHGLPPISSSVPPIDFPAPPYLTRTSPAGPAMLCMTETGTARVISVPGRYSVAQIVEGPDALVVCDIGSTADIPLIERVAQWTGKRVAMIVPTHLHFDHIMGVNVAAQRLGAEVALGELAHDLVTHGRRPRPPLLKTLSHFFIPWFWQGLPLFARTDIPSGFGFGFPWSRNGFASLGPVLTDGGPVPHLPGWTTLHTPGHTDESVSLYHREAGFLVAGDTVRNYLGGEWNPIITDHAAYDRTIERLRHLPVQAIFPGHGPVLHDHNVLLSLRPF